MWRRQMSLGQGRGLGELADRLLSASLVDVCCDVSAGEVELLLVVLWPWHHHMAGLVQRLSRQRLLEPETDWEELAAFEVQLVGGTPGQRPHHVNEMSHCLQG